MYQFLKNRKYLTTFLQISLNNSITLSIQSQIYDFLQNCFYLFNINKTLTQQYSKMSIYSEENKQVNYFLKVEYSFIQPNYKNYHYRTKQQYSLKLWSELIEDNLILFKQQKYYMEGTTSKSASTQSLVLSLSRERFLSQKLLNFAFQMKDCLSSSEIAQTNYHFYQQTMKQFQDHLPQSDSKTEVHFPQPGIQNLLCNFRKSDSVGIIDERGYFSKRDSFPIILIQNN